MFKCTSVATYDDTDCIPCPSDIDQADNTLEAKEKTVIHPVKRVSSG